ncbi:MAG: hypothetical protein ACYTFY_23140, partial [Planctomycetota bacterium]
RWIKEKTAKEKKKNDRENLLSARARSKTTKIFAEIIRNRKYNIEEAVKKITAAYPYSYNTLSQYSSHYKARVRSAVITILSELDDSKSADLLCRRVYLEGHPAIQKSIAEIISSHPQKDYISSKLISILSGRESHISIRRISYALNTAADDKIIPLLIEKSDHSPAKPAESQIRKAEGGESAAEQTAEKKDTDGKDKNSEHKTVTQSSSEYKADLIYPAAECLKILTGRDFGPSKNDWLGWWEENKEVFVFTEAEIPALKRRRKKNRRSDPYHSAIEAYTLRR